MIWHARSALHNIILGWSDSKSAMAKAQKHNSGFFSSSLPFQKLEKSGLAILTLTASWNLESFEHLIRFMSFLASTSTPTHWYACTLTKHLNIYAVPYQAAKFLFQGRAFISVFKHIEKSNQHWMCDCNLLNTGAWQSCPPSVQNYLHFAMSYASFGELILAEARLVNHVPSLPSSGIYKEGKKWSCRLKTNKILHQLCKCLIIYERELWWSNRIVQEHKNCFSRTAQGQCCSELFLGFWNAAHRTQRQLICPWCLVSRFPPSL